MPEPQINIRTDAPSGSAGRARKAKRSATPWIILGSAGLCMLAAAVIFAMATGTPSSGTDNKTAGPTVLPARNPDSSASSVSETAGSNSGELVVDDPKGELLWASPTAGEPIDLAYVPAGTQCLIQLRPEDLLATFEGERIVQSLGPWQERAFGRLRPMLGTVLPNIDSLLIAVVVNSDGKLDVCLRADLHTPMIEETLVERVSGGKEHVREQGYLRIGDRAYFLPKGSNAKPGWLVVCPANLAPELIETGGEAPALVRDVERLAEHTDSARIVTIVVAPQFLLASGNELLTAEAAPLHEVLEWLLDREATAVLLSAHWDQDESFFVELRATPTLNEPARRLAAKLRERIAAAPDVIEEIVLSRQWPEYGRKVLARLPSMMRALARYSRAAEDDRQAVVRAYLPPTAGHNLVMASELLLAQARVTEASATAASAATPQTLAERLAKKTSLTFSKETLERAVELLAEDSGLQMAIQGADLQLEGITKNQSLAIDFRDRPLQEILVEVLLRANPDRTAAGPGDPKQKLVYVMEPDPDGGLGRIIVTTRAAVERRGMRLPDVFLVR